ncbi:hypothetical protein LTR84_003740 [Exophiala bonariae]|uniref:Uncharacterized protein n=1 Tax=Exophiala bonariae TaxID=1690606 RepID=A0AAV9N6V9_9EURO|nr:hypothetical protein LTR84_003740 [Exophiala bonariae]
MSPYWNPAWYTRDLEENLMVVKAVANGAHSPSDALQKLEAYLSELNEEFLQAQQRRDLMMTELSRAWEQIIYQESALASPDSPTKVLFPPESAGEQMLQTLESSPRTARSDYPLNNQYNEMQSGITIDPYWHQDNSPQGHLHAGMAALSWVQTNTVEFNYNDQGFSDREHGELAMALDTMASSDSQGTPEDNPTSQADSCFYGLDQSSFVNVYNETGSQDQQIPVRPAMPRPDSADSGYLSVDFLIMQGGIPRCPLHVHPDGTSVFCPQGGMSCMG